MMKFTNILTLLSALSTSVIGADMDGGRVMAAPAVGGEDVHFACQACPDQCEDVFACLNENGIDNVIAAQAADGLETCLIRGLMATGLDPEKAIDSQASCNTLCEVANGCVDQAMDGLGIGAMSCSDSIYAAVNCVISPSSTCACTPSAPPPTSLGLVASILRKNLRA